MGGQGKLRGHCTHRNRSVMGCITTAYVPSAYYTSHDIGVLPMSRQRQGQGTAPSLPYLTLPYPFKRLAGSIAAAYHARRT